MNVLCFTGNLGRDSELRTTPNDKAVLRFSVAMRAGWGNNETTTWVNCALWGERGRKLEQKLRKGVMVAITGEASLREFQKRDQTKGFSLECNVSDVTLCGGSDAPQQSAPASTPAAAPQQQGAFEDDDIPF